MKKIILFVLGLAIALPVLAAQTASGSGRVLRVDHGHILIKQSAIEDLNLPAASFAYDINPNLVGSIKAGDQVSFEVQYNNGHYRIIQIHK